MATQMMVVQFPHTPKLCDRRKRVRLEMLNLKEGGFTACYGNTCNRQSLWNLCAPIDDNDKDDSDFFFSSASSKEEEKEELNESKNMYIFDIIGKCILPINKV